MVGRGISPFSVTRMHWRAALAFIYAILLTRLKLGGHVESRTIPLTRPTLVKLFGDTSNSYVEHACLDCCLWTTCTRNEASLMASLDKSPDRFSSKEFIICVLRLYHAFGEVNARAACTCAADRQAGLGYERVLALPHPAKGFHLS